MYIYKSPLSFEQVLSTNWRQTSCDRFCYRSMSLIYSRPAPAIGRRCSPKRRGLIGEGASAGEGRGRRVKGLSDVHGTLMNLTAVSRTFFQLGKPVAPLETGVSSLTLLSANAREHTLATSRGDMCACEWPSITECRNYRHWSDKGAWPSADTLSAANQRLTRSLA